MNGKKLTARANHALLALITAGALAACNDADVASANLSKAADQFELNRRIVFYNGITGDYMLVIEGRCSVGNDDKAGRVSITCKTGPGAYKKHLLGLSNNVTFLVQQIDAAATDASQYRVIFKPVAILPDIEVRR